MTAFWVAVGAIVAALATACVGDLVSEEVRGRLDRLPYQLIRLAARHIPQDLRSDRTDEWEAELHEILRGVGAFPITRLVKGTRFAFGLLRTASVIGDDLVDPGPLTISANPAGVNLGSFGVLPGLQWVDTPDYGEDPADRRTDRVYDLDPAPLASVLGAAIDNRADDLNAGLQTIAADGRDGPIRLTHLLAACDRAARNSSGGLPDGRHPIAVGSRRVSANGLPQLVTALRRDGLAGAAELARSYSPSRRYAILSELVHYALAAVAHLRVDCTYGVDPTPLVTFVRAAVGDEDVGAAMHGIADDEQDGPLHLVHLIAACDRAVRETGGGLPGGPRPVEFNATTLLLATVSPDGLPGLVHTLHASGFASAVALARHYTPQERLLALDALLLYFTAPITNLRIDLADHLVRVPERERIAQ